MLKLADEVFLTPEKGAYQQFSFTLEPAAARLCFQVSGVDMKEPTLGRVLARVTLNGDAYQHVIEQDGDFCLWLYPKHFANRKLNAHVLRFDAALEVFDKNEDGIADGLRMDDIKISNLRLEIE